MYSGLNNRLVKRRNLFQRFWSITRHDFYYLGHLLSLTFRHCGNCIRPNSERNFLIVACLKKVSRILPKVSPKRFVLL